MSNKLLPRVMLSALIAALGCGHSKDDRGADATDDTDMAPHGPEQVRLRDGETLDGVVLSDEGGTIVLAGRASLHIITRLGVDSVSRNPIDPHPPELGQLPTYQATLSAGRGRPWASQLEQIEATVVDVGNLAFVPYSSHRAETYEINVYGDPEHPVAIEMGTTSAALRERNEVRAVLADIFDETPAEAVIRDLGDDPGSIETKDGLLVELTTPDQPDAYGAWWITVSSPLGLDAARARASEIQKITQLRQAEDKPRKRTVRWSSSESMTEAMYDAGTPQRSHTYSTTSSNSGRVYVHGYYRKNGTYVQPHTRSRPSRRR